MAGLAGRAWPPAPTRWRRLRALGARVEEGCVPFDLADVSMRNGRITAAEAYARHCSYIEDEALDIDPWVRQRVLAGKAISAAEYREELAERKRAAARFNEWMQGHDALLTPTLPITAVPLVDVDEATSPLATFTRAVNYFGACGLSLPVGLSADGLPIGMQLVGAAFADISLLRFGHAFQSISDWHRRRPDLSAWA